ncbi:hypothetical protein BDW02DRAFT_646175 [Decorospora gaudefroyi]|uniref:Alpha-ketoglutarate-dependent dioxygenase AlkB-like domain-containing protein n=1 Tax=Decorospora gaudefroyi TaxID=184978 RepID=A0A6A5KE22_9PLEO|nr:hypothetical protein BDW02DRAFT_646175 [Decorospora gaudefroyi]
MAPVKYNCDDSSEWEGATATKRPRPSHDSEQLELQRDPENYGTASSQRPTRNRKRPDKYVPPIQSPRKRAKVTPNKRLVTPRTKPSSKKSAIAEKNPTIVRLKVPLERSVPTTPAHHSPLHDPDVDDESALSSPPTSTTVQIPRLASTYTDASLPLDGQTQCAQHVSAPVPTSSQYPGTPSSSQTEPVSGCTPSSPSWLAQAPAVDGPRKCSDSSRGSFETRQSVSSQDVGDSFTYPTPDSVVHQGPENAFNKSNVSQLKTGQASNQVLTGTQATLPLCHNCHETDHIALNCTINKLPERLDHGEVNHIPHECTANVNATESIAQSSIGENQLSIDHATDCGKHLGYPHVGSPTSSYACSEATTECDDSADLLVDDSNSPTTDTNLHAIAEQLLAQRNIGQNKPEPSGQPEVWADGRQELCETLHYFRAYQSASYSTGGFVRGFMFDKVAHHRDYIDSNVVISRAGGGLTKDKDSGEMRMGRDQAEDAVSQALKNCMIHRNPVVIITGVDNPHIPSKPPHQYCALDYFKPTHIWVEKSGGSKIVRYRFEKLNTTKESWWHPKNGQDIVELGSLSPPVEKTCDTCRVQSLQVYLQGWMCLQPTCTSFWKISRPTPGPGRSMSLQEPKEASLMYDPRFLKQKTPWPNDEHDYPLISNTAELSGHSIPGEDTSVAFWSGMVCPKCGRCISRLNWMGWECANTTCDYSRRPPHTLIPALSLRDPLWPVTNSYTLARDTQSSLIEVKVSFEHGYRINQYKFPGIDGFISHMMANKTVLEEEGGPDAMFEELQQTDIGLQRRSMPNGQLKGPNYCRHFLVNYGMPYKFIAATASHSFEGAARPITSTRSRLNWAAKLVLAQESSSQMAEEIKTEWQKKEFNEVLALGYFEEQKINYHDDGEYGLGPTIATLSLGAPGTMRIRMKARRYHGISSVAGLYDDAAPIPGCQQYEARRALHDSLTALKQTDPRAYHARRKQIPKDLGLSSRGQAKDVLTMQLAHGDVVIMHGADVQRYYEHAVEHAGKLRFALTCRYIDPLSLKESDQPGYVVGADGEGYDGTGLAV